MTKKEFISKTAKIAGFTNANMEVAFDAIIDGIKTALNEGETVTLNGIGKIGTKESAPRIGRNPITGETINVPKKKKIFFKVSTTLKKEINS